MELRFRSRTLILAQLPVLHSMSTLTAIYQMDLGSQESRLPKSGRLLSISRSSFVYIEPVESPWTFYAILHLSLSVRHLRSEKNLEKPLHNHLSTRQCSHQLLLFAKLQTCPERVRPPVLSNVPLPAQWPHFHRVKRFPVCSHAVNHAVLMLRNSTICCLELFILSSLRVANLSQRQEGSFNRRSDGTPGRA
ncbi:hypothetical protein SISNIDRAFT_160097 [Sistotremastrum niveocremeum HHB9708]|uniref:Uncharacterized protein n=1 Tax=Sistotremastrum niveocremeum HHB9708 TaxID=1314777 RepID=A0A164SV75_9AGAM|nr:hypothetical protein SISNIDRAFT_160097 [Sistotremastrum niveocremeum HHB9708]